VGEFCATLILRRQLAYFDKCNSRPDDPAVNLLAIGPKVRGFKPSSGR
jgi:hypothetical protein